MKILINDIDGLQKMLEVHKSGGYFDQSRVIWNEKVDGQFPEEHIDHIGGLSRSGNNLIFSQATYDAQQVAIQAAKDEEENKANLKQQAIESIRSSDINGVSTIAGIKPILKAIVDYLK
jgi:hypothetical protein